MIASSALAEQRAYPRPQLVRPHWESLDGVWQFAMEQTAQAAFPRDVKWDRRIVVPFAPETAASGIHDTGFHLICWYRRELPPTRTEAGQRLLLHFGAVDYATRVWVNDLFVGGHRGGYTPFTLDITDALGSGTQTITVRAEDDPADLTQPRGKQDWRLEPHAIWYPRTSGIWQTVWLETVASTRIDRILWRPNLARWEVGLEVWLEGPPRDDLELRLTLSANGTVLARDRYAAVRGEIHRRIALSDPGIDDYRNELLWSPSRPQLIDAELELVTGAGEVLDRVSSYTALRDISLEGDRFVFNGRQFLLRLVLDQGYWPESGMTAPSDEALRRDVELVKLMGFNGVRKHQKLEDPRFLYWADRLGLLVWEEMPSAYRFTGEAVDRVTREWTEAVRRDASHPCIVAWVPLNESWGVPNLPQNETERHYVRSLYYLTKTLDPTRPVIGNDGWESVATDIIGIHDYETRPDRLAHRYHADRLLPHLLNKERPGGRTLYVGDRPQSEHPIVLSEFGGIALAAPGVWAYRLTRNADELAREYGALMAVVHSLGMLTGFCYTQLTDTYQEANGLLTADRRFKFPLELMRAATLGPAAQEP
jgi:beta-galactosidase/beta-glucuronidase